MPRYEFTLGDLARRSGDRRRMALELLLERPRKADELARIWGVHPNSAYKVLLRLEKKQCVSREREDGREATFRITDRGQKKLDWLINNHGSERDDEAVPEPGNLHALYPELDSLGGVIEGPVALQRLVEVDNIEKVLKRIPASKLLVERKFDGWLCQAAGGRIYSRRGKELTEKFPPIEAAIGKMKGEHLVGELVYWDENGQMNESVVTSVAGTADASAAIAKLKAMPGIFQLVAFDLIGADGQDISGQPFINRRKRLEKLVRQSKHLVVSPAYPFAKWQEAFKEALAEGGEGVIFKNIDAPFFWRELGTREPHPTGVQYKLKAVRSDDFVVFDHYRSEKDKLMVRFGQFWRGELIEVGDLDNFSAETESEILRLLKKGPFVMEIGFQERFPKPPGRLRNPRFLRFRPDKPIESATLPPQYAPD